VFLFVYFTGFLYQQVSHVVNFYSSSVKIRSNIRKWNAINRNTSDKSEKAKNEAASRSRLTPLEEEQLVYQEPQFIHTFVIPNYGEPEPLLRDSIGRLANHR
jgi:hypothetical protein